MKTAEATAATTTVLSPGYKRSPKSNGKVNGTAAKKTGVNHGNGGDISNGKASFMKWTLDDVVYVAKYHRLPCFFAAWFLFFIYVEYTLRMVPDSSPPFDLGFVVTRSFHRALASWPELNSLLAALNTVFVAMQSVYIIGTWVVEGRPRATISALFMFTCRGILGYSTQLPLPQV
ncbi:phosphatidylcholine:diacylglycerol cholinephosphotransferase 1-like [Gossypium australe]|uniref:Phosphatidylcholine:diacylglycerol cholinephosphotransferase 1-like n=1 Tax=Gossypium australe TaxID=47621 RepID=A0A5B6WB88_9ROSI|nr:phosphatidylcholine:diacylglycerol cholinephosphotransferase 1-like [Gossypium australe]